jgi:hypothetical protein
MRCSLHRLFVALLMVVACVPGLAQRIYNLGSAPAPEDIKALDGGLRATEIEER